METIIDDIKIDEMCLCAQYTKENGASLYLKIEFIGPSDFQILIGRIKCENVLPTNLSFENPLRLRDGYKKEENHHWGNHYLQFTVKSNFDIENIKLNCSIEDVLNKTTKKDYLEAVLYGRYYKDKSYIYYTITCPYNKIIFIQGYSLSKYLDSHNHTLHGNDYENYLESIDKVYIKYKEKG